MMRLFTSFFVLFLTLVSISAFSQNKPVHPVDLYDCIGKNTKWVDRYVRAQYGIKPERKKSGKDTVELHFYSSTSDVEVSLYLVGDVCEYVGFTDYNLDQNGVNTYFTRWCSDVTDHDKFITGKDEKYPMFEDESSSMVFYIPEDQSTDTGLQYFMFAGFVRGEQVLSMN
jgi:hypothetical protein